MTDSPKPSGQIDSATRLKQFVKENVLLDSLMEARVGDIEFIETGGRAFFTPDQSTWFAYLHPSKNSAQHRDTNNKQYLGFASIFSEADEAENEYIEGAAFSCKQVTKMLGNLIMDEIFSPESDETHQPHFFLTDESKSGLEAAIQNTLDERSVYSASPNRLRNTMLILKQLSEELVGESNSKDRHEKVAKNLLRNRNGVGTEILEDLSPPNLTHRISNIEHLHLVDWEYLKQNERDEELFPGVSVSKRIASDVDLYSKEFEKILRSHPRAPNNSALQPASLAEILALNFVLGNEGDEFRFFYLTNSFTSIELFDDFVWNPREEMPLKFATDQDRKQVSVSRLFVRHPLCFVHDVDNSHRGLPHFSSLKDFSDTVVPKEFSNTRRLSIPKPLEVEIDATIDAQAANLEKYSKQLDTFFHEWNAKKKGWVNQFINRATSKWVEGLELYSEDGFTEYQKFVDDQFAHAARQMGICLALISEEDMVRAAPLIYIDCDLYTQSLLDDMQHSLNSRNIVELTEKIEGFFTRDSMDSSNKRDYFDALINALLFMFSNQFQTAKFYSTLACVKAGQSEELDITGREAFYLNAQLTRICATGFSDLNEASRLLKVATSALSDDNLYFKNNAIPESVSPIRIDLEEWSLRIVSAIAKAQERDHDGVPGTLIRDYYRFVKSVVEQEFGLSPSEKEALIGKICDKISFNFLVLLFSTKFESSSRGFDANEFKCRLLSDWNETFRSVHERMVIKISDDTFERSSTLERSYYLWLACTYPQENFVEDEFNVLEAYAIVFEKRGDHSKPAFKIAQTSFLDKKRFKALKVSCSEALGIEA